MRRCAIFALIMLAGFATKQAQSAAEALVAVASNFIEPARVLAAAFSRESGRNISFSSGSTGALYAQITHGAPFDAFLAAGDREPAQLAAAGLAMPESRFTYAVGSLVVWSSDPSRVRGDCKAILRHGDYRHVAIANSDVVPLTARRH